MCDACGGPRADVYQDPSTGSEVQGLLGLGVVVPGSRVGPVLRGVSESGVGVRPLDPGYAPGLAGGDGRPC